VFFEIWDVRKLASIFSLNAGSAKTVGTWDSIPINWNLNLGPLDMIIQARAEFNSIIFREYSSRLVGSFGTQETESFSIMARNAYKIGKGSLRLSLDWFVPKPRLKNQCY
jgi:hypothetical protein